MITTVSSEDFTTLTQIISDWEKEDSTETVAVRSVKRTLLPLLYQLRGSIVDPASTASSAAFSHTIVTDPKTYTEGFNPAVHTDVAILGDAGDVLRNVNLSDLVLEYDDGVVYDI